VRTLFRARQPERNPAKIISIHEEPTSPESWAVKILTPFLAFLGLARGDTIKLRFRAREGILNWVWAIALIVFYVVLTRWILPKFGVPT
jgi:hypothetical protein